MRGEYIKLVESVLSSKNIVEDDDKHQAMIDFVEQERSNGGMGYVPGSTAITRQKGKISTVASTIEAQGLIPEGSRILHAGAGKPDNPDRAYLDTKGEVHHYDPGQEGWKDRSPIGKHDFDVVVSPFVLNVLNTEDRMMPIKDMINSLKPGGIAIIGVRGFSDIESQRKPTWAPWDDGYLIPKGKKITFQKGFTPSELVDTLKPYFKSVKIVNNKAAAPVVMATR